MVKITILTPSHLPFSPHEDILHLPIFPFLLFIPSLVCPLPPLPLFPLILLELPYVNISASSSISRGTGRIQVSRLVLFPSPTWLLFHTKSSQLSLWDNGERKQLPKLIHLSSSCLFLLFPQYHYFSTSFPTLRSILCLDTQSHKHQQPLSPVSL